MMSADYKTTPNEGEFVSDSVNAAKSFVNVTKVAGKTIEGDFSAELVDKKAKKNIVVQGKFKGLDEQVGSKGFN
jgi:tRNA G37 N-methylase TrmD